ncbi:THUMP domain-containing protein [Methanobacterium aggregans]|uniref:THUMP domain-containing protein n=1 Tax=Methanobacterium aggregans TaxID=1615586 RepID=UPI00320EDE4F
MALQNNESIVNIEGTEFINVVLVQLNMDPLEAAMKLKDAQTTVISKVVPIEEVVRTRKDAILEKVLIIAGEKIEKNESFVVRCDLRGRSYFESSEDLVSSVREELLEKLNLKLNEQNPEWVVQLEVVGENTGISILRPGELFKKL